MDAYAEQSAGSSAGVVWPTAAVASAQFPTRIAVARPNIRVKRWRVRDICGKYMPSGSDARRISAWREVAVVEKRKDCGASSRRRHWLCCGRIVGNPETIAIYPASQAT